jgi:hypothetical protein
MSKLDLESRMTIKALLGKGVAACEVARLLGVTEGAVRYHVRRMQAGATDGRSAQPMKAESMAEAIDHWREQQGEGGLNLAALHEWLQREHGYGGSLRSVQRCWMRRYPRPLLRARRRVETPGRGADAGRLGALPWGRGRRRAHRLAVAAHGAQPQPRMRPAKSS